MKARIQHEPWPQLDPLPTGGESCDFRYVEPLVVAREEIDFAWKAIRWNEVLDYFDPVKGDILDVGAGFGDFLCEAKARGWNTRGLEISESAIAYAEKNFELALEHPDDIRWDEGFDAVCCAYTLEHIGEPRKLVEQIYQALRPGGMAYFCVPNDFNDLQLAAVEDVEWWVHERHVNYFNFETLGTLLTDSGFKIRERLTQFPMELFLLLGENYIGRPFVGRACHWKRRGFDATLPGPVRLKFYKALASAGLGRTAEFIVEK